MWTCHEPPLPATTMQFDSCATAKSAIGNWEASNPQVCSGHVCKIRVQKAQGWQPLLEALLRQQLLPTALLPPPPLRAGEDSDPLRSFIRKDSNQQVPPPVKGQSGGQTENMSEHQSGAKQTVRGTPRFLSLTCSLSMYSDRRLFNAVFSFMIVICIL